MEMNRTHALTFIFGGMIGGAILMFLEMYNLQDFFTLGIITMLILVEGIILLKDAIYAQEGKR